ncbi:hypothetical protein [Halioxenophilus sp. WMMB6]|uniref:hypothetical protein n=1 Tax=Halioxenophilus sp. WMMB6 TaxID=3073815 RepID=UPI00295F3A59|nr:hypothetical protein [Halioxenophilus sp. WMMB6]
MNSEIFRLYLFRLPSKKQTQQENNSQTPKTKSPPTGNLPTQVEKLPLQPRKFSRPIGKFLFITSKKACPTSNLLLPDRKMPLPPAIFPKPIAKVVKQPANCLSQRLCRIFDNHFSTGKQQFSAQ